jgi:translocation and assembly module TamB
MVAAEGTISMDAAAGYPVNLTVTASNAKLVSTTLTTLTADVQARMSGALMQNPLVSGTVSVDRWDIRVPERLAATLTPIKVTHRNAPAGFVTGEEEDDEAVGSALPFRLDVAVRAPREVFVRGQGIDAEFGGEARLGGTLDDPAVRGRFDLRRGAVNVLSQRIILSRGSVQFLGGAEPVLDIAGSVTKNGVAATVSVKGRAGDPQIALSSTPSLPQDEILSRLLFSKQTTQLSPFEAAQLAQVIGRWSGLNTGPDILERLRTVIGIDALTATTDPTGKTSVAAGSYLGRGVYVGVSEAAGGSATVDVDLTDTIKLRGEAGTTGTKVGVAAEWEY